jgi:hypothetical protein
MDQGGDREEKDGAEPCAIEAGGDGHQAQGRGEGARRHVRIHDDERGSGNGKGEAGRREKQGTPAGEFIGEDSRGKLAASCEKQKDGEQVRCEENPLQWEMREADQRGEGPWEDGESGEGRGEGGIERVERGVEDVAAKG